MTRISRNNYEVFFVDYLDGTLNPETLQEVEFFLEENLDLKQELTGLKKIMIPEETELYPDKKLLYKSVYDEKESFQNTCVAFIEDDLTPLEKEDFEQYLQKHPELKSEVSLFSKTKLKPDLATVFPDKRILYHHSVRMITWYKIAAVAATLATVIVLSKVMNPLPQAQKVAELKTGVSPVKQYYTDNQLHNYQTTVGVFHSSPSQSMISTITGKKIFVTSSAQNKISKQNNNLGTDESNLQEEKSVSGSEITESVRELASIKSLKVISGTLDKENLSTDMVPIYEDQNEIVSSEMNQNGTLTFQSQPNSNNHSNVFMVGMKILSNLTGKALHYKTDEEGRITNVAFNSKLIEFNIPLNEVK